MPILIFFLAMFGIVSPRFLWKNIRYAILAVFLVAAVICPSPDPWTMCIYAVPMLALYVMGIGVAWWVHPSRRKAKEAKEARQVSLHFVLEKRWLGVECSLAVSCSSSARAEPHFNGAKALEYARQFVAIGPRWPTSPGHLKAEQFLRDHFQHDQLEEDAFTANTPIGPVAMRNFIVRFPGKKNGVIVLATHYETNYWLRNINFVGANDGGSTTGLLMAIADQLRGRDRRRQELDGYSVWLVFVDGEEAIQSWSESDSTYGSRHLAAKWGARWNAGKDQGIHAGRHDRRQGPGHSARDALHGLAGAIWCGRRPGSSATSATSSRRRSGCEDDQLPFVKRGVPSIDIIDLDYGPNNSYHHTAKDTMDKISAKSLTIDGDVFMETIRLINQR